LKHWGIRAPCLPCTICALTLYHLGSVLSKFPLFHFLFTCKKEVTMSKPFYSVYGRSIKEFLSVKRSLGFKYQAAEYELGNFDKIAYKREESSIGITKELASEVCARHPHESEKSRYNR